MRQTIYLLLSGLILLSLFIPTTTLAQEPGYGEINDIAKQLNCPTCGGRNLASCDTVTCEQWRGQISDLLQEGYSDAEVIDYFSAHYGDQVLQEPPRRGFTLLLWILPLLILVIAGGWLYYTLRRWAEPQAMPVAPSPPDQAADGYLDQVERDLGLK